MGTGPFSLKSDLNQEHIYAVGLLLEGKKFFPIQSYSTIEELEKGFEEFYRSADLLRITRPVAVEKNNCDSLWENSRAWILSGLMEKVIKEKK